MFWKKKDKPVKVKEPTPYEIMSDKIAAEVETLTSGQAIIYQISEYYSFARFLGVELNPAYPQKGKKYLMFTDQMADGKPTGKRSYVDSTNKPLDFGRYVAQRDDDKYGHVIRYQ